MIKEGEALGVPVMARGWQLALAKFDKSHEIYSKMRDKNKMWVRKDVPRMKDKNIRQQGS